MPDGAAAAPHPEIWALTQLAAAAGAGFDDAFALGMSGGAGLLALAFRDTRAARSQLHLTGWNPFGTGLLTGIERAGLHAVVRETGRRRKAARQLDEALSGGDLAAVWVDGATLGLAPAALAGASPTVVVARAAAGGGIELSDGIAPAQVAGRADLEAARAASPAHRHRVVTVGPGTLGDLATLSRRGLAGTAVGPAGGPPGASGAEGVRALADVLGAAADDGEASAWAQTFPDDHAARAALVALHAAVATEDGLLRPLQASFTAAAARATGLAGLAGVAEAYGELARGWRELGEAALPADVPGLAALRGLRSAWALDDAGAGAAPLPLSASELHELRHGLAARLSALADLEDETLERLRAVLRAG